MIRISTEQTRKYPDGKAYKRLATYPRALINSYHACGVLKSITLAIGDFGCPDLPTNPILRSPAWKAFLKSA